MVLRGAAGYMPGEDAGRSIYLPIYICMIRVCRGRMMVVEPQPDDLNGIQGGYVSRFFLVWLDLNPSTIRSSTFREVLAILLIAYTGIRERMI